MQALRARDADKSGVIWKLHLRRTSDAVQTAQLIEARSRWMIALPFSFENPASWRKTETNLGNFTV
jgi:hypothetical protein